MWLSRSWVALVRELGMEEGREEGSGGRGLLRCLGLGAMVAPLGMEEGRQCIRRLGTMGSFMEIPTALR